MKQTDTGKQQRNPWYTRVPECIERSWTTLDAFWSGTETVQRFRHRSLFAFCAPLPVWLFVVYGPAMLSLQEGPRLRGGILPPILLLLAVALQWFYFCGGLKKRPFMATLHLSTVTALTLANWLLAPSTAVEASTDLYFSYYGVAAVALLGVAVLFARWLRKPQWFRPPAHVMAQFHRAYDPVRIANPPLRGRPDVLDVIVSCIVAALRTPLHVIAPVALYAVFMPRQWITWWMLGAVAGLSLLVFAASNYDPARDAFVRSFRRLFLSGGSLLVTLFVLLFAVLRVAGVDYVTTVLDAQVNSTLFSFLLSTYALFWLYDFWVAQASLDLLGNLGEFETASGGELRRHGSGRIMVIRPGRTNSSVMLEPTAFLQRIAATAPEAEREELLRQSLRIEQRLRAFVLACGAVVAGLAIGAYYILHALPQKPGLRVTAADLGTGGPSFHLADQLAQRQGKPVLLLAASGGGTRAAIFTAAVLHGLHRVGRLDELLVGSGVSGGSAALACFAARRPTLRTKEDWDAFGSSLARPFIGHVLAGLGEWRIMTDCRLGLLLAEALGQGTPDVRFDEVRDLGLIFNTSLCGVERGGATPSAAPAGGRLILTNLDATFQLNAGAGPPGDPGQDMAFEIVWPPRSSLFAAAALSANFPPVFSNAAIDVELQEPVRYWVTDGGLVENRGELSLLLALHEALTTLARASTPVALPPITVAVAEASALAVKYTSDRGFNAKVEASSQVSRLLVADLRTRITALYERLTSRKDGVRFVELPMPEALRVSGAFGTHWMMPPQVAFLDQDAREGKTDALLLDRGTVLALVDAMCDPDFTLAELQRRFPGISEPARLWAEISLLVKKWRGLRQ